MQRIYLIITILVISITGCGGGRSNHSYNIPNPPTYTICKLLPQPSQDNNIPCMINNVGQIIGNVPTNGWGYYVMIWNKYNPEQPVSICDYGMGYAINDKGQAVGMDYTSQHATIWSGGKAIDLGTDSGDTYSLAHAINASGVAVGYSENKQNHLHAVLWQTDNRIQNLSIEGTTFSNAIDINDSNMVAGIGGIGNLHLFLWENGQAKDLDIQIADMNYKSVSINNKGQIAVNAYYNRALLWENGRTTDLGYLYPDENPFKEATPCDINDLGQVVGESFSRAFLWQNGIMYDLNKLIPNGSEFLKRAISINNHGDIICRGYDGKVFLLRPSPR